MTVDVFWINGGEETKYSTLNPGKAYDQQTYVGHEWIIRNQENGEEIGKTQGCKVHHTFK